MNIESRADDGLVQLTSTVARLMEVKRFGDALSAVQRFVERVIFDPASIAKVFTSPGLDSLCKTIAMAGLRAQREASPGPVAAQGTVILVSELSLAGGHNELIRDIVRLRLFPKPVRIIQTDCFERGDEEVSRDYSVELGVAIQRAEGSDLGEKFDGIVDSLGSAMPRNVLLLAHNQDALAVSSAFAAKALAPDLEVVYIHHGDHHLSLGAATREFVHVDPHNIGYFHCRDVLGHESNRYWPLIARVKDDIHRHAPFLAEGRPITCSSGRAEKFEAGSYRYDYFELLPFLLRASGGTHIHIGGLLPERLEAVAQSLRAVGVDPAKFVHVPWVKSVAQALIQHGVDLYVSSFPLGGGKATLEAMAAGIPLLMHQSYRSRFLGGEDIAYPGAFVWRTPDELLDIVGNLDAATLAEHSARARRHYETYHHDRILMAACDFSVPQDVSVIPSLKEYHSDPLECFFDDERRIQARHDEIQGTVDRQSLELSAYERQAREFQEQLVKITAATTVPGDELRNLQAELAHHLRETQRHRQDAKTKEERRKFEANQVAMQEHVVSIDRDCRAMASSLAEVRVDLRHMASQRQRVESDSGAADVEAAELRAEIRALRASTSWRITKPLRYVLRLLRQGGGGDGTLDHDSGIRCGYLPVAGDGASVPSANPASSGLPSDFIGHVYLKLNPDLIAAGVDPASHFLSHGQREGRRYALPDFTVTRSPSFDASRQTMLLVSHEASRTGAPILSLNLAQLLVRRYNVVALLLGGGALKPAFEETGATVLTASTVRGNPYVADYVVSQICDAFELRFALVNSIESRTVLPALSERFVPTISLIHEFASYTRPRESFRDALQWSSEVVFSAHVTRENALSAFPELAQASAIVLPQGKCILPTSPDDVEGEEREAQRLRSLIRPAGLDADTLIVLGAGFVQLRKGVDLFIDCAARVKRQAAGRHAIRFVWIGNGYDPEVDVAYSVYLQDQIRRAELSDDFVFLGETSAIEAAYGQADLFLLSSRLDPLPNVAIDAMAQGVPVLCFDKTTGIADFLHDAGLGPRCVAGYLDTDDIARKIVDFASSRESIAQTGSICRQRSAEYFDMARYVERIESLAEDVQSRVRQEEADVRTIVEAGVLRTDFANRPPDTSAEVMARPYVRTWASGIGRRKPFPGFHPGIYMEQHGVQVPGGDPLADYLRRGRPQGAWNYPVITPETGGSKAETSVARLALHIHAYYVDLLPDILARVSANRQRPDLFISVTSEGARQSAETHARAYPGRTVAIRIVPNRGRDIGPFFTEFLASMKDSYGLIGHVHTKKSVDVKDGDVGRRWFRFLMDNLLGDGSTRMMDVIVERMRGEPSLGMVIPDDPHISGMEANRSFAQPLSERLGIQHIPEHFLYPIGTMFWARPAALGAIDALGLTWEDYPPEPVPYDGSMLHALERLITLVLPLGSWTVATTNVKGTTR